MKITFVKISFKSSAKNTTFSIHSKLSNAGNSDIKLAVSYILKLNDFLFVCAELIEELARATDLKFGIRVEHVVATNKF